MSSSYEPDRWLPSHSIEALYILSIVHCGATPRISYQSGIETDFTHSGRS